MSSECSHWWHTPIYIVATVALIIASISSSSNSPPSDPAPAPPNTLLPRKPHGLTPDASVALHRAGYHLTAALLQMSPVLLLPPGRSATLFAAPDSALSNLSLPAAVRLFRLHVAPLRLPLSALLHSPRDTCFPTLLRGSQLVITSVDGPASSLSINGVPITHPNIFLNGLHVVHGSSAAFPRFDDVVCDTASESGGVQWAGIVRALEARGYVSFSLGLSAVLDALARDAPGLDRVTVFAPGDAGFDPVAVPAELAELAVRGHLAVGQYVYAELAAMRIGEELQTLADGWGLRITSSGDTGVVTINGVAITEPDAYETEGVVVHGVSRAFGMAPLET